MGEWEERYRAYTSATNTVNVTPEGWAHYKREQKRREEVRRAEEAAAAELAAEKQRWAEELEETERLMLRRQLELEQNGGQGVEGEARAEEASDEVG